MARCFAAFVACFVPLLPSCGETEVSFDQGQVAGPPLAVSYLLEGGAADGLQALFLVVQDIRLLGPDDPTVGIGALPAPVTVELLGLEERAKLLTTRFYGNGTFTHVGLVLGSDPTAVGHDGEEVEVETQGASFVIVPLDEPLLPVLGESINETIVLSVNPDEALRVDDGPAGALQFRPVVRARRLETGESICADDYFGSVVSAEADLGRAELASDQQLTIAERAVVASILIPPSTLLLQSDGQPKTSLDGLSEEADLDDASFWVGGAFERSEHDFLPTLRTDVVLLDSAMASEGSDSAVVAEVRIVGVESDGVLRVRPLEIERGAAEAEDALGLLGQAAQWRVQVASTTTVLGPALSLVNGSQLTAGMRVKLHFPSLLAEPFPVARAVVQGRPSHPGVIAEAQVLDTQASVLLSPDAAAIEAGFVATAETAVDVKTASLFATLDVEGEPSVLLSSLLPGVRVVVRGRIAGDPDAPAVAGGAIVVRPGRFRGFVSAASALDGTFEATVESVDAPFGGDTSSPPFRATIPIGAVFEGEASSQEKFFGRFASLENGERLLVTVAGLGTGAANEVRAYQIHSSVE